MHAVNSLYNMVQSVVEEVSMLMVKGMMHGNVFQSPGGQGSDPGQQPYQNAIYYFNDRSPDVAAIAGGRCL